MTKNKLVLAVDVKDRIIEAMEKLEAHKQGTLHRAFSVLLFNENNELLLQQRAKVKYHSGGQWANTCCSHPRDPDQPIIAEVKERLKEELNLQVDEYKLMKGFEFIYKADVGKGLVEHEYDHVFVGRYTASNPIIPNPEEVETVKWMSLDNISKDMITHPNRYAPWFKILMNRYYDKIQTQLNKLD